MAGDPTQACSKELSIQSLNGTSMHLLDTRAAAGAPHTRSDYCQAQPHQQLIFLWCDLACAVSTTVRQVDLVWAAGHVRLEKAVFLAFGFLFRV